MQHRVLYKIFKTDCDIFFKKLSNTNNGVKTLVFSATASKWEMRCCTNIKLQISWLQYNTSCTCTKMYF